MAGILDVLESLQQIVNRWVSTQVPIMTDVSSGDTTIEVRNTIRLLAGDEVIIMNSTSGEIRNYIEEVVDDTHIILSNPVTYNWSYDDGPVLQKTYDDQILAGIYLGEPENIPKFPAVVIKGNSTSSEWLTIDSTKEEYKIDLSVYMKAAAQEKSYKAHIRLAETLRYGLKKNIRPLIGPYTVTSIIADINPGDSFIKVYDSSQIKYGDRVLIEGEFTQCETLVVGIIDEHTIRINPVAGCSFLVSLDSPQLINPSRFIYNSWPSDITYGEIYKGTLLKAARLSWFAQEEVIWTYPPVETNLR